MDQSDEMLLNSIKQVLPVPQHVKTLHDMKLQQISALSLSILQYFKVDITQLKGMMKTPQRFRSMTKLNQALTENLDAQFQLNQLMNPSVPFIRKALLFFITKITALASQELKSGLNKKKQSDGKNQDNENNQNQKIFKEWLKQQWVHPILNGLPKKPSKIHNLHFKFKSQTYKELENSKNMVGSLNKITANAKLAQRVRQRMLEDQEGLQKKEADEVTKFMYSINDKNEGQWNSGKSTDPKDIKRNKKIRKYLFRTKQKEEQTGNQPTSVFKQQVEKIAEEKKHKGQSQFGIIVESQSDTSTLDSSAFENPIQKLKREAENRKKQLQRVLHELLKQIKSRKQYLLSLQSKKEEMQSSIQQNEEKITGMKTQNNQFKKELQKKQVLLNFSQNQTQFNQEVNKLEKDVELLEKQANSQIEDNQKQIKIIQKQGKQKIEILNDLKMKLTKIQTDYKRVCEQIEEKQDLKSKVKIIKSGISRLYYSKKISEVEGRWRDAQKQTNKMKASLQSLRQNVNKARGMTERVQTEIQNLVVTDKLKNQNQTKMFKDIFQSCQATFKKTMSSLDKINQVKIQTHQYETKVHSLAAKAYPANIQKLKMAMQQLRKQVNQSKSKRK